MNERAHWAFWLIAILGLLWNVGGIANYMMQMKPDFVAAMPDTHQAIINGRPTWATAGFAVGVFGGAIGCLLLLVKKPLAGLVFLISLVGIFVTMIHTALVVVDNDIFSVSDIIIMIIMPIIVANFLIGFTFYAAKKNWIAAG